MFVTLALSILLSFTSAQDRETVRQSEAQFARGVAAQQKGDLDGARQAYEAALKLIPRRMDALSNLGVVYAKLGRYDEAIKHYQAALLLEPTELAIRFNLGIAYFEPLPRSSIACPTIYGTKRPNDIDTSMQPMPSMIVPLYGLKYVANLRSCSINLPQRSQRKMRKISVNSVDSVAIPSCKSKLRSRSAYHLFRSHRRKL